MAENTTQRQEFIEAIENDESYEWELTDNLTIFTDWESDGSFYPVVYDLSGEMDRQEVDDLMTENDVDDVFEWELDGYEQLNNEVNMSYAIVTDCEYERVEEPQWV